MYTMYKPKVIFGDKQIEAVTSVRETASLLTIIEKRLIDPPDDVKRYFEILHMDNAVLAHAIGGSELLEEVYFSKKKV